MDLTEGRRLFSLSTSMWSELQLFIFIVVNSFLNVVSSTSFESVSTSSFSTSFSTSPATNDLWTWVSTFIC